jgi:imidazolonepropionase-like amidohydrolase
MNVHSHAAHAGHGSCGCLCHSPQSRLVQARIAEGLSRRSVLKAVAGALAASALPAALPSSAAPAGQAVLLADVRVFDGTSPSLRTEVSVLVRDKKIEALVPRSATVEGARVIGCGGRVLMPGLIDAHWHSMMCAIPLFVAMTSDIPYLHMVAAHEAQRTLLRGFTTVRDVGGPSFAVKRAIDEGLIAGPRIYPSGAMISQTSGHGDFRARHEIPRAALSCMSLAEMAGIGAIADGVPEVLRRVREQLLLGASQIKIMGGGGVSSDYDPIDTVQFTDEEIRAAVAAAGDWGTYVCTHVYMPRGIQRGIRNGVKCIEHGQLADEETARMMADAGTWWSLQPFLADEDSNEKPRPDQRQQQLMIAQGTVRAFELAKQYRIQMAWGTDILFAPDKVATQGKQLAKMGRWFEPHEVLQLATSRNAALLALSGPRDPYPGRLGVIEAGAWADLLLIDGNPLEDLALLSDPERNFVLIMKDGRIHKNTLEV